MNLMLKKKYILFLFLIIICFLAFLPPRLLETNIQDFSNKNVKNFAEYSIQITNQTLENPLERLLIISYGISLDEKNDNLSSAKVTAYTLFGIPFAKVKVTEDGASVTDRLLFD
jgi:hypothetical protein